MATCLDTVVIDALEPLALGRWWAEALGWTAFQTEPGELAIEPPRGEPGLPFLFEPVPEPKTGKNRVHLDLSSASAEDQAAQVDRLKAAGATPVDIGQGDVPWVVLGDPEGNELCVLDHRAEYADAGRLAAIVLECRDPVALTPFWQAATGWAVHRSGRDLVSLRPPVGAGPALELLATTGRKTVKNRLHFDVVPLYGGDQAAEVSRLEALGGRRLDIGQGRPSWVVLADPEGNELCVLGPLA